MTIPNAGREAEKSNHPYIAGGNAKWHNCSSEEFGSFLKTEHVIIQPWTFVLLDIYTRETKSYILCKNLYMNVYNDFICKTESWKQPRCLSMGEWFLSRRKNIQTIGDKGWGEEHGEVNCSREKEVMNIRTKTKRVRKAQSSGIRILLGCLRQQVGNHCGAENYV